MEEAEKATNALDAAFKNTGATVGLTRTRLDTLATSIQNTTTVSDDLVKEGESILLTFDKVRGQAFERTIKVATDLSARLGTDLKGSIRQVGLALQDPVAGLTLLRRSGISFSDAQKDLIKGFLETNQAAKAQNLILSELERRFGGSAAAARNTLGGALTGLKNAFGDLFEGTRESTASTVTAINDLSKALTDPALKQGIDTLINSFAKLVEILIKAVGLLGQTQNKLLEMAKTKGPTASAFRGLIAGSSGFLAPLALLAEGSANAQGAGRTRGPTGAQRRSGSLGGTGDTGGALEQLEEIKVTAQKIVDANADLMQELADSTKTGVEKAAGEYIKLKETLQFLNDQQLITSREQKERLGAALDELLPEFDLNQIKSMYISLKKETTELGEFMKGVWQGVGRSIQSTLSDAIYEWRLSWRSLLDIARRALADITSAILISGIKKAFASQLASSKSSGGWLAAVAGLFGLASGGDFQGPRIVGEDGPELVTGRGHVTNQRQMAFAGMTGSKVNYSPQFNVTLVSTGNDESDREEIYQRVALMMSAQQEQFTRVLVRSGVEVKG